MAYGAEPRPASPTRSNGAARQPLGRPIKEVLPMPNLNAIQRDSFDWFMREGLQEVLTEFSPIDRSRTTEV
jgi:DNA-directed RNA polymerase subunit beta